MADLKTTPTGADVSAYVDALESDRRRRESRTLLDLFARASGSPPAMWGSSIIGFGSYHYRYDSGREGDWFLTGFSPRNAALSLYIMPGFDAYATLLARLGKHKTGRSCLYVNALADIDLAVLEQLVGASVARMREMYEV